MIRTAPGPARDWGSYLSTMAITQEDTDSIIQDGLDNSDFCAAPFRGKDVFVAIGADGALEFHHVLLDGDTRSVSYSNLGDMPVQVKKKFIRLLSASQHEGDEGV